MGGSSRKNFLELYNYNLPSLSTHIQVDEVGPSLPSSSRQRINYDSYRTRDKNLENYATNSLIVDLEDEESASFPLIE